MKTHTKKHWENIYRTKNFNEVSWYQKNPKTSIKLILSTNLDKNTGIIDVGGGDSNLADNLINLNFENISVLDISLNALEKSKQRIGKKAKIIKWICSNILEFETNDMFDIWHDRALFHFLTSEKDIKKYVEIVNKHIKPKGYLIIATFSVKGPQKCSGLNIKQYSEDSMKKIFGKEFKHIKSIEEKHNTPCQASQDFIYNLFRKTGDKK